MLNKVKDLFGLNHEHEQFFSNKELNKVINLIKKPAFSSFLPYIAFDEDNELFINKNSIGFVIETTPMLGASEEIEQQLTNLFQHTLPKGSNIQFLLLASPRIAPILSIWEQARLAQNELFQKLASKRRQFLEKMASDMNLNQGIYLARAFKVLISFSMPGAKLEPMRLNKINQIKTQVLATCSDLGMPGQILTAPDSTLR